MFSFSCSRPLLSRARSLTLPAAVGEPGRGYGPNSLRHQERCSCLKGVSTPSPSSVLAAETVSGSSSSRGSGGVVSPLPRSSEAPALDSRGSDGASSSGMRWVSDIR